MTPLGRARCMVVLLSILLVISGTGAFYCFYRFYQAFKLLSP